jgi:hypothetical protein
MFSLSVGKEQKSAWVLWKPAHELKTKQPLPDSMGNGDPDGAAAKWTGNAERFPLMAPLPHH